MKIRNLLLFLVLSFVFMLVACSNGDDEKASSKEIDKEALDNLNDSEMPIVKDPITLHFLAGKHPTTASDYNEVTVWKKYEEMSNIKIDWEMMPKEGLEEKRNLALASGSLPDVFYTSYMPNNDLVKYGKQGVFLTLNDLIEEYMPNLTKLLEEYPEIKKGITFPDGNIYGLPTIYDPEFPSLLIGSRPWIRQDWLDQLNMEMPQTTDDFYEYLKAVKETDLNGNGKADEIPFGGTSISGLRQFLAGSFGVNNNGRAHLYTDIDPETNEMRFFPIDDGYKELLQYMNKLYSEGLIHENIYTIDTNQSYALGSEGLYGSTVITSAETIYGEAGKNYVGMTALEGPNGDRKYTDIGSALAHLGGFVVTKDNANPAATLRWMDYFYSEEGTKLFFMGVEGETYEKKSDGSIDYVDEIKNSPEGLTLEQELKDHITWLGGGYPGIVMENYFKGAESLPSSIEAAEGLEPYLIEDIWPKFTYTVDESKEMSALSADIEKYVDEMQDKFITGNIAFSEWDKYVKTIKDMGLEDYMSIEKAAYDRYKNNE
ncbi:extracellular solute-binding protein [Virgibacillus halodenitrificans]|uniref:extracellular solute-binding protein n=1 Tax=Virgibacillus halodenitrificans TaxID=1482 RepID=UPI0002EDDFBD|nr:extracellular solute-binding protein [Virgibacillus halodenitrificans]